MKLSKEKRDQTINCHQILLNEEFVLQLLREDKVNINDSCKELKELMKIHSIENKQTKEQTRRRD